MPDSPPYTRWVTGEPRDEVAVWVLHQTLAGRRQIDLARELGVAQSVVSELRTQGAALLRRDDPAERERVRTQCVQITTDLIETLYPRARLGDTKAAGTLLRYVRLWSQLAGVLPVTESREPYVRAAASDLRALVEPDAT